MMQMMTRAFEVPYDNATSKLAATNVQGALDELAAKAHAKPQLESVTLGGQLIAGGAGQVEAHCPDEAHDIATGGGCFVDGGSAAFLEQAHLNHPVSSSPPTSYRCVFKGGTAGTAIHSEVVCLRNAR
jgi:hypothetical protein